MRASAAGELKRMSVAYVALDYACDIRTVAGQKLRHAAAMLNSTFFCFHTTMLSMWPRSSPASPQTSVPARPNVPGRRVAERETGPWVAARPR